MPLPFAQVLRRSNFRSLETFLAWRVLFGLELTLLQKYYIVVNLVKTHSVEELVLKLNSGKTISKEQVVRESLFYATTF